MCNPPFGARPDCFTGLGHYMVTSSACASAYGRMWNIPDATPLANVAQHIISIQNACAALKTQVPAPRLQPVVKATTIRALLYATAYTPSLAYVGVRKSTRPCHAPHASTEISTHACSVHDKGRSSVSSQG